MCLAFAERIGVAPLFTQLRQGGRIDRLRHHVAVRHGRSGEKHCRNGKAAARQWDDKESDDEEKSLMGVVSSF